VKCVSRNFLEEFIFGSLLERKELIEKGSAMFMRRRKLERRKWTVQSE
jgi:hypothetical protein